MRLLRTCLFCGRDTITDDEKNNGTICFECKCNEQLLYDLEIGRKWRENSSLEAWFPDTSEEITRLKAELAIAREKLTALGAD